MNIVQQKEMLNNYQNVYLKGRSMSRTTFQLLEETTELTTEILWHVLSWTEVRHLTASLVQFNWRKWDFDECCFFLQ